MFIKSYYYDELVDKYRDIDFSMGITLNSNLRFFSIRPLTEASDIDTYIEDYAPFFEMDTLVEINGSKQYVKTMASTLDNFIKVTNPIHYTNATLEDDEVIITRSLSDSYQLEAGDYLTLFLGDLTKEYNIVDIVDDGGLFQGETIYLNKEGSLSFFLSALNPSLGSLNPILLTNFYNQVYFEVKSGTQTEQAMQNISSITQFSGLNFQQSIDEDALNQLVRRTSSFFNFIVVIVVLVILLVMQTTFLLYFQEKKKGFAIVKLLGGSHWFSYGVVLIEILFFFTLSLILSVFISNAVMQNGLRYVGSSASYQLELSSILWSALIASVIYILTSFYYFTVFNKESSIQQTMSQGIEKEIKFIPQLIIFITFLFIYFIPKLSVTNPLFGECEAIIQSLSIIAILFSLAFLLIYLFSKIKYIKKKPLIFALQFKILSAKKSFYQYIAVMLVCFVSIFLLVLSNDHMNKRISNYENEFKVDFILTNFISRYDETFNQIEMLDNVDDVAKVGYLKSINFVDFEQNISSVISIDSQDLSDYFNFDLSSESLENLSNTQKLVILLPERFQMLYAMQIGEIIHLNISPLHPHESFEIGGFFKKEIGDMALVNLHLFPIYDDVSQNAIFVNASANKETLKNELINLYSKNMVYILDFQLVVDSKISELQTVTDYMIIILSTIIGCFILSIFNHSILLLEQMKDSYARLYVLGFSKRKMLAMLTKESALLFFILMITSIFSFILLSGVLSQLILISGEYENIQLSLKSVLLGSFIILLVFIATKIIYLWGVLRIKPSDVVKTY